MKVLFLIALLAGEPGEEVTFAESEAYVQLDVGESMSGFPNWDERLIHQWINRARSDPQAELRDCSGCADAQCYAAVPPLGWSEALNRAARFHADSMRKQGFFGHDTPCLLLQNIGALYPGQCDGSASCACSGAGTTSWRTRISMFGASATGEIIASTSNSNTAFYLWLNESTNNSTCQFTNSNGHRWLMLKSGGAVGVGVSGRSAVDFGFGTTPLKIVSGSHYPRQAETVELWANWYDFAPPRSAAAVVDGRCVPMILRRGTPQNGAYMASVSGMASGCYRYYFTFIDAAGAVFTYPSTGSLGIGGSSCPDWDASRMSGSCSVTSGTRRRSVRR